VQQADKKDEVVFSGALFFGSFLLNKVANKQKWMKYFDASVYLPFAKPLFLFINGNKDYFYNVVPYHKTYSLIPKEQWNICIKPGIQHTLKDAWDFSNEIRCFFESVIYKGTPLAKVESLSRDNSLIKLTYKSNVSIVDAEFWYLNDSTSTNSERVWMSQKVKPDNDNQIITCPFPAGGFKFGFFYLKDARDYSVSSEFIMGKSIK
jgi:hypothetical protein